MRILPEGVAERFARFRRVCAKSGRDPAQVRLSTTLPVCCGATRAEAARRAGRSASTACGCCGWVSPAIPAT